MQVTGNGFNHQATEHKGPITDVMVHLIRAETSLTCLRMSLKSINHHTTGWTNNRDISHNILFYIPQKKQSQICLEQ